MFVGFTKMLVRKSAFDNTFYIHSKKKDFIARGKWFTSALGVVKTAGIMQRRFNAVIYYRGKDEERQDKLVYTILYSRSKQNLDKGQHSGTAGSLV